MNAMDAVDLVRILYLYDTWVTNSRELRAPGMQQERNMCDGITMGVRESWHALLYQCYLRGDHSLLWAVPLVARAVLDNVQPSARVLKELWKRRTQAPLIDRSSHVHVHKQKRSRSSIYERTLVALCAGVEVASDNTSGCSTIDESKGDIEFEKVTSLVPSDTRDYWLSPIPAELLPGEVGGLDIKRRINYAADGNIPSAERCIPLVMKAELKTWQTIDPDLPTAPGSRPYALTDTDHEAGGYHTSVPRVYGGTCTVSDSKAPVKRDRDDCIEFGISGGYNRYSLHNGNAGGLWGWTGKFARPSHVYGGDSGLSRRTFLKRQKNPPAKLSSEWPFFMVLWHVESWGMSSFNISMGSHRASAEALLKIRTKAGVKSEPITSESIETAAAGQEIASKKSSKKKK
jgi:hypothetical protein